MPLAELLVTIQAVAKAIDSVAQVELEKMKANPDYAKALVADQLVFHQFFEPFRKMVVSLADELSKLVPGAPEDD